MPQIFKFGSYWVYFWTNEGKPVEPVHVHISKGNPSANATKVWITSTGKCYLCHNNSHIPTHTLHNLMRLIETQSDTVIQKWIEYFGEAHYYC